MGGTLGGARTFGSVVDCTALWLYYVLDSVAGLAGVHGCWLGVIHWCATELGGVAASVDTLCPANSGSRAHVF